jgi:hypothetical protein
MRERERETERDCARASEREGERGREERVCERNRPIAFSLAFMTMHASLEHHVTDCLLHAPSLAVNACVCYTHTHTHTHTHTPQPPPRDRQTDRRTQTCSKVYVYTFTRVHYAQTYPLSPSRHSRSLLRL